MDEIYVFGKDRKYIINSKVGWALLILQFWEISLTVVMTALLTYLISELIKRKVGIDLFLIPSLHPSHQIYTIYLYSYHYPMLYSRHGA